MSVVIRASQSSPVAVITGASAGIGLALARELHSRGMRVALLSRRTDRLESLAAELNGRRPGTSLAIPADVTDPASLKSARERIVEAWGQVDWVVANAGFAIAGRVDQLSIDDYRRQFETNVFGVLETYAAFAGDLSQSRGRLGVVGSVNSYFSLPTASAYCMSKFALRAWTEALTDELAPTGVSVTLICPGFVATEIRRVNNRGEFREQGQDPIPPWIQMPAEKAARQMADAISRRCREAVITGHGKLIVWLARHMPWIPRLLARKAASRTQDLWNEKK